MAEKIWKPNEPRGDPALHRTLAALEQGLAELASDDREAGRVALIVRRGADGAREVLSCSRLDPGVGVPGDDGSQRPPRDPEAQLAVMNAAIATLIANGQPLTTFGNDALRVVSRGTR